MAGERLAAGFGRLHEVSGEIRLAGLRVEKTGSDRTVIGETHGGCVERGSLTMRSDRGCTRRCRRRISQDSPRVGRRLGMVREPGEIRRAPLGLCQQRQGLAVQRDAPVRWERRFERQTRQLMAESEPARVRLEHPRGQALLERLRCFSGDRVEQP